MNSPFPGMDPYLEDPAFWRDFHLMFIVSWRAAIADVLPARYEARLDETLEIVQMPDQVIKLIYPDVAVSRSRKRPKRAAKRQGGTAVMEPTVIPHKPLDKIRRGRIEILHRPERSLVAVLELLSPTNKVGDGFADYCSKRQAILENAAHLVELDLLLGGRRLPLSRPLPGGDYYALVSRTDKRPNCEVYSWFLHDTLPLMPIPLRAADKDIVVDLQSVFRRAYQEGRYVRSLGYGQPPKAPIPTKDKRWVVEQKAIP